MKGKDIEIGTKGYEKEVIVKKIAENEGSMKRDRNRNKKLHVERTELNDYWKVLAIVSIGLNCN